MFLRFLFVMWWWWWQCWCCCNLFPYTHWKHKVWIVANTIRCNVCHFVVVLFIFFFIQLQLLLFDVSFVKESKQCEWNRFFSSKVREWECVKRRRKRTVRAWVCICESEKNGTYYYELIHWATRKKLPLYIVMVGWIEKALQTSKSSKIELGWKEFELSWAELWVELNRIESSYEC